MLDHQAARRLRQGAYAAGALALALVSPARAQVDLPIVTPPVVAPPAPGPNTVTLGGDAAHRNVWAGTGLRPPLEVAWSHDLNPLYPPLAVGSRVVVESAGAITAYDAADGAKAWTTPITAAAELATDGARVFLAGAGGVAALNGSDGKVAWVTAGPAASGPVAADGRLIVGMANGDVAAYTAANGARQWNVATGIAAGRPAVAGSRAYVASACRAVAIATTTGLPIWSKSACAQAFGSRTLLAGPYVVAEDGPLLAAQDGALVNSGPGPGTIGGGVLFRSPLAAPATSLVARDAGSFAARWTWSPPLPGALALRPAVVESAVYQVVATAGDGALLGALDAASGRELWTGFLPAGTGAALKPGLATTVTAAAGLLLVPTGGAGLVALRNAPAGPLGVAATLPRNVVTAGSRTVVTGALTANGHGLVGPRDVSLEADPFPLDRGYDVVAHRVAGRAGFRFRARVRRNTNFRLVADGVTYPPTIVYAQPKLTIGYRKTRRRLVVAGTLRVRPALPGRVGVYRLRPGATTATRLGAGTARRGVARFRVRIPPTLTKADRVLTCLRGGSKRGYGVPNVLDQHCGDAVIAIPAQASAAESPRCRHGDICATQSDAERRSLSTATGSAMPLKRLWPASENA